MLLACAGTLSVMTVPAATCAVFVAEQLWGAPVEAPTVQVMMVLPTVNELLVVLVVTESRVKIPPLGPNEKIVKLGVQAIGAMVVLVEPMVLFT